MRTKTNSAIFGVVVVLLIILIWADQSVTDAIANQDSFFGTLFQTYGEFPPALLGAATLQILVHCLFRFQFPDLVRYSAGILLTIASYLVILEWARGMVSYARSWSDNSKAGNPIGAANNDSSSAQTWSDFAPAVFTALILLIIIAFLVHFFLAKVDDKYIPAFAIAAVFTAIAIWGAGEINHELKSVWGRFRPYEVDAGKGDFTTWLEINMPNGHRSFPSGHTQEGTTLAALAIMLRPVSRKASDIALYVGAVFGALMALSRVIVDAHWASDTVASFGLTYGFILAALALYEWVTQRVLSADCVAVVGDTSAAKAVPAADKEEISAADTPAATTPAAEAAAEASAPASAPARKAPTEK